MTGTDHSDQTERDDQDKDQPGDVTRRRFLRMTAAAGAGMVVAGALPGAVAAALPGAAGAVETGEPSPSSPGPTADSASATAEAKRPGKAMIDTVGGAVSPDRIGGVLAHEHLFVDFWGPLDPHYLKPINGFAAAVDVIVPYVLEVKAQGVELIVDWGPLGVGRSVKTARTVWKRTGVKVAVPTGIYKNLRPAKFATASVDDMTRFMVGEFANGIEGTGIKPAFVKIAASPVPAAGEVAIHRASAQAAAETGATLACHLPFPIDARTDVETARARQVFEIAMQHGVKPDRFVWGHATGIIKADKVTPAHLDASVVQHLELAEAGATIQFDAVGSDPANGPEPYFGGPTDPEVFLTVLEQFANLGYGDRVMISNDASVYVNPGGGPGGEHAADYLAAGLPVWQYPRDIRYLHGTFASMLEARVGAEAAGIILRDTPLRVFSRVRSSKIDRGA
jgi:predicted metal-dependent phosphotriesterase family hydrolase